MSSSARATLAPLVSRTGVSTASELAVRNAAAKESASRAPGTAASGRVLPVRAELAELLPWQGLRCGSTVSVRGSTSLLLALLASATAAGSWAAVVGSSGLGVLAASELGVSVHRLALVPRAGADLGAVVAALLEGVDLVAVRPESGIRPELARRLSARARHHKTVLLPMGEWPAADVTLRCLGGHWTGVDAGHGYLSSRSVTVEVRGRGAAARPVRGSLSLPGTERPDFEGPGFERPDFERAGFERAGFERPDFERPGFERAGFEGPGFEGNVPADSWPVELTEVAG